MSTQLSRGLRVCRPVSGLSPCPLVRATCQLKRPLQCVAKSESTSNAAGVVDEVDFQELAEIVRLVNSTDIVEMEWKGKKFNLSLKKKEALKAPEPVYQMMQQPQMQYAAPQAAAPPPPPAAASAPAAAPAAASAPKPAAPVTGGVEVRSPMSGTFYASAAPGEPAFVKVGDKIKRGQTVGIIEAMKLMNEIEAEVSGEVIKVLAENGKPITSGQPLFLVKT